MNRCEGNPTCGKTPSAFTASVSTLEEAANGIYRLIVESDGADSAMKAAEPGQFYMLKAVPSQVLLSRPISIYKVEKEPGKVRLHFLIMLKGQGTKELCSLEEGDSVKVMGPLGNTFAVSDGADAKAAVIGGGIGVAPVAGFASTLKAGSYDFYACFRSGTYGLEGLEPAELTVTTDDGSVGVKGMLPDVFTADVIKAKSYGVVYACGPEPMLAYVQKVCAQAGTKCFLSMEARMACGVGACLGCTIPTTEGNRRCCKDGPVFPGEILMFPERNPAERRAPVDNPDISVDICGVHFKNPVIAASGTFGYGNEYKGLVDVGTLGGICSKGLTLEPKPGNKGCRLVETTGGLINSIGLENPGIRHFVASELPEMMKLDTVVIANLSGSSLETYVEGAKLLDATDVPMIELNISCPNVKAGGMAFGLDPAAASEVTSAVRKATSKPLIVKLSPNAPDLKAVAAAVREAGADAISMVNTFQATSINIETGKPVFANIHAGYSGPAVKPIALRMVYEICKAMKELPEEKRIPVIALGGIQCWQDAVEFIMAGAEAVQVGTATFADPSCMTEISKGLAQFMKRKGYASLADMRGIALP